MEWLDFIFGGFGVAVISGIVTWVYRRRRAASAPPPPPMPRSLVKGNVGANSAIRRARVRGAHHLVEGDMGDGGKVEDIDFR
jgi:hypothetical protein